MTINPVIDSEQLKRIESVHRGFLYQHLYAVGVMLLAPETGVISIFVERDEDMELQLKTCHAYVQLRTRSSNLEPSDIRDVLERFKRIRESHSPDKRQGRPDFYIISNASLGPKLNKAVHGPNWPPDVTLICPNLIQQVPQYLPPAWSTITEGLMWCARKACTLPFMRLSPETLVWKLAAIVQYASSGTGDRESHRFLIEELPRLFEQIVIQLQRFPSAPHRYRKQEDEPVFASDKDVRIISGISGSGKTAWASEAALHHESPVVYFDIGNVPGSALPVALSRELAGHLFAKYRDELGDVLLPGHRGVDAIRAIDLVLSSKEERVTLVLDNVHLLSPSDVVVVIHASPSISWILLGQPSPRLREIAAILGVKEEPLNGWSIETIASEFRNEGCGVDPSTAERLRRLTGGFPLYVLNTRRLTKELYCSDARLLSDSLEDLTHSTRTYQEHILSKVINGLSERTQVVLALLSLSDIPLQTREISEMLASPLSIGIREVADTVRTLVDWGVLQPLQGGDIVMQDAFRLIATNALSAVPEKVRQATLVQFENILERALVKQTNIARQRQYLRLLPLVGKTRALVDIASSNAELFAEMGFVQETMPILAEVAGSDDFSLSDRFWALDTLILWTYQDGNMVAVDHHFANMERVSKQMDMDKAEKAALATKSLLISGRKGDIKAAHRLFEEVSQLNEDNPEIMRILKYDFAVSLYHARQFSAAEQMTSQLIKEYYDTLGLEFEDVFAKNPPEIFNRVKKYSGHIDDLRRLAGTLTLHAMVLSSLGQPAKMSRIHAFKFYTMTRSLTSAVKVGQDVVDEFLSIVKDPLAAKRFMEQTLLPMVKDYKLLEHVVPVYGQYAVVLAYCGKHKEAFSELIRLKQFIQDDPARRAELENQYALVEAISQDKVSLATPISELPAFSNGFDLTQRFKKVGRNKPCPCGSGKKYKYCCGRRT